ncbi:MAG: LysR family transcriptional regulator [Hyphomicrobiales bacterium]
MTLHLVPRSLQYLECVAKLGSIQAASRELGISASAVHRQIVLLEEMLGEALFSRDTKGVTLTYSGRLILDMSRNWRLDSVKLQTLIQAHKGVETGQVRIAAMDSMVNGIVLELVKRVSKAHPKVTLEIEILSPKDAVSGIRNGDFDIAIVSNPGPEENLKFHWSREFVLGCIATPEHPLAQKNKVSIEGLASHSLVFQSKTLAIRQLLEAHHGWLFDHIEHAVSVNSIQLMKLLVASGNYIAVTSQLDAAPELEAQTLTFIPISDDDTFNQTIALVSNAQMPVSIICRKVLEITKTILETH